MNVRKRSILFKTNRIVWAVLFILFSKISNGQNSYAENWQQFILPDTTIIQNDFNSNDEYFLIKSHCQFLENKLDVTIIRVLNDTTFIVKCKESSICNLKYLDYFKTNNLWKLPPHMNDKEGNTIFNILSFNIQKLKKLLNNEKINIVNIEKDYISVATSLNIIKEKIVVLPFVTAITNESNTVVHESNVKDHILSKNGFSLLNQNDPELFNKKVVIGLKDNLPNANDIDLFEKVSESPVASNIIDSHATDMATIILGSGNNGNSGLGVLPNAAIFPMDFKSLTPDSAEILDNVDVSIINNSYGTKIENFYGVLANSYDSFLYKNPAKLHVFSSGNSGDQKSDDGVYKNIDGYSNLTGNYKMCKNCITVGAANQEGKVLPFSSKGPAYDGRVKPEMVAYSTIGTSNAAALVTGAAVIVQQAFIRNENKTPPSCLLKAALLNGADDIEQPGVDFKSGYGNLNITKSVNSIDSQQYFIETIKSDNSNTFSIAIPKMYPNLKLLYLGQIFLPM